MIPRFLYVHVPFCARRCSYCDFAVIAAPEPPVGEWLDAIETELARLCERHGWGRLRLETVYVGGGTPSLLGPSAMAELRDRLERRAELAPDFEWTAEANPESFDAELAEGWRAAGVNRVSLGVQTFDPAALRWMGRLHGPEGPARAVAAARRAGIDDISLDLIFALPRRLGRDWPADVERALALEPDHVSLYGLVAEEATPLGRWVRAGRERMPDEEAYAVEYLHAARRLAAEGFDHYEVSNFARAGRSSRHNSAYWTGDAYVGLGPGAHSFLPPVRSWNVRSWQEYRDRAAAGLPASAGEERVEGRAARLERVWLGLRTAAGLPLADFGHDSARELVAAWERNGWASSAAGRVRLTPEGWLLLDRLALELADAVEAAAAA